MRRRWRRLCWSTAQLTGLLLLLGAASAPATARAGTIIAPSWANTALNPCAARSWQLVRWPDDGQCYHIFQQGPCAASQQLAWDRAAGEPVCVCPDGHLLHSSGRCYRRYSRGPCQRRHFFIEDQLTGAATCRRLGRCAPGHMFWPADRRCYRYLSLGPCGKGQLFTINRRTEEPECGCSRRQMTRSYWKHTDSCYEERSRGPCPAGLVFVFNSTRGAPQCECHPGLLHNFHRPSGQCFGTGQPGPCPTGNTFEFNTLTGSTECRCRSGSLVLPRTGGCHRAYAQGPCRPAEFLVPRSGAPQQGVCVTNPCRPGELYFPSDQFCHRIGRRGPCAAGELVQYEQYRGVSYRGTCGCTPHFTQNFWPPDGRCYQLHSRGPCQPNFTFVYNTTSERTECRCETGLGWTLGPDGHCNRTRPDSRLLCLSGSRRREPGKDSAALDCQCPAGTKLDARRSTCMITERTEGFTDLHLQRVVR